MENDKAPQLIVGLGNPGLGYVGTRHNIGFATVKALAKKYGLFFEKKRKLLSKIAIWEEEKIILALPQTYMNLSGKAVKKIIQYFGIPIENILVVTDDCHIPFAKLRLKAKGSCGGHNGLRDIENVLQTDEYSRLKMGIGMPPDGENLEDFVLNRFSPAEKMEIPAIIAAAINIIDDWRVHGIAHAMNEANAKIIKDVGDK